MMQRELQTCRELLESYKLPELRERLAGYPARIAEARGKVQLARQSLERERTRAAEIEAEFLLEIQADVDDKGKPRFTNAEARAAELLLRKKLSSSYQLAASVVRDWEGEHAICQGNLDGLMDEFLATRYVARLAVAELGYLTEAMLLEENLEERINREVGRQVRAEIDEAKLGARAETERLLAEVLRKQGVSV